MERIESNRKLCHVLRRALEDANMERGILHIVVSDGRIVLEREGDSSEIEEDIFEACEYILENADDDELINVQQTLESELEERGIHRYVC